MPRVRSGDGVSLHAEATGEGPPVVFSCALNTTSENWRAQVETNAPRGYRGYRAYRTVRVYRAYQLSETGAQGL